MKIMTKQQVIKEKLKKYLKANKDEKGQILDGLVSSLEMHRKAIIRRFKVLQLRDTSYKDKRGREKYYTKDVEAALKDVWSIGGEICAERLHEIIFEYIDILERDKMWNHDDIATGKLRSMSVGTMKNIISKFTKVLNNRKGLSSTKPSNLKELIPVRRGPWKDVLPGVGEIDTVAHCGNTLEGSFAYTLQYTDVNLLWCFLGAQMCKNKKETVENINAFVERTPFDILILDPDTGSEFINWHMYDYCKRKNISLTRIRPGVSNDHGRIEQKNNTNVRKYAGYIRIDTIERLNTLKEMYISLEIYINHFIPSQKCIEKIRKNIHHSSRKYDKAATPYQRYMNCESISQTSKDKMYKVHEKLNPKILGDQINKLRTKLFKNAKFTKNDILDKV